MVRNKDNSYNYNHCQLLPCSKHRLDTHGAPSCAAISWGCWDYGYTAPVEQKAAPGPLSATSPTHLYISAGVLGVEKSRPGPIGTHLTAPLQWAPLLAKTQGCLFIYLYIYLPMFDLYFCRLDIYIYIHISYICMLFFPRCLCTSWESMLYMGTVPFKRAQACRAPTPVQTPGETRSSSAAPRCWCRCVPTHPKLPEVLN